MLSHSRRSLLAVPVLLLALLPAAAAPAPRPSDREIAQWVRQLGDNSFAVRENASKKLWAAGEAAEPALEEALKSEDVEVVRRAREILEKFKWGIYPETPAEVVALIQTYQSTAGNVRAETLQKLLRSGPAALQAVVKIARAEENPTQRLALGDLVAVRLPSAFPEAMEDGRYERFEALLERGHDAEVIAQRHYTAYWLLRGKLDERIAHFRARLAKKADDRWAAETLTYLLRARGDRTEARAAAEKAARPDLVEGILFEQADWKALAARRELTMVHSAGEQMAFRAAFARLAGQPKEFEAALADFRKHVEATPKGDNDAFLLAKTLFLNDRPAAGLEQLAKLPKNDRPTADPEQRPKIPTSFDILCARLQFREAFDHLDPPARDDKAPRLPDPEVVRTLMFLGETDKAKALCSPWAETIKDGVDANGAMNLLRIEYQAGLKEEAFEHCARVLSVSPNFTVKRDGPTEGLFLSAIFPLEKETAEVWWTVLRGKFKDESAADVLKRLRNLLEGKTPQREVKALIEEAERHPPETKAGGRDDSLVRHRRALAEVAAKAELHELAFSLLEKADTPTTLLRIGDLFAGRKQWAKAAESYRRAWQKKQSAEKPTTRFWHADPLPLFLAGDALVKAGRDKEGAKLIEQSHWVSLGDAPGRFAFMTALAKRGQREAVQRETDLLLRVGDPNAFEVGAALRRPAILAANHKEYLKAAEGLEQSMLGCLHSNISFVQTSAFASVPAQVHQTRAAGLVAAGRLEEAQKEIDLALTAAPGYVELPVVLVPELERRGHKKEAAALFERCINTYEKVCRDYPRCAWAHNSAAWLAACCRRDLDRALTHARKAVELSPSAPGYLDTLAEVHFQRGEKDQAIAAQKRVVEMNPKRPYFRKQLRRLEAGDPSAERPPENDLED